MSQPNVTADGTKNQLLTEIKQEQTAECLPIDWSGVHIDDLSLSNTEQDIKLEEPQEVRIFVPEDTTSSVNDVGIHSQAGHLNKSIKQGEEEWYGISHCPLKTEAARSGAHAEQHTNHHQFFYAEGAGLHPESTKCEPEYCSENIKQRLRSHQKMSYRSDSNIRLAPKRSSRNVFKKGLRRMKKWSLKMTLKYADQENKHVQVDKVSKRKNLTLKTSESEKVKDKQCSACQEVHREENGCIDYKPKQVTCQKCGMTFSSQECLTQHESIHPADQQEMSCNHCNAKYHNKKSLLAHILTHIEWQLFTCRWCGKKYQQKCSLQRHMRLHSGIRFVCDSCGAKFIDKYHLSRHMLAHTDEKAFLCEHCGRAFKQKKNLDSHITFHHTGSERYECPLCTAKFRVKMHLRQHMQEHPDARLFTCSQCGMQFFSSGNLRVHQLVHQDKQFSCDLCSAMFRHRTTLVNHMLVHSKERPFCCPRCPSAFSLKTTLTRHMSVHSDCQPYACTICGSRFKRRHSLTRHITRTHKGDLTTVFSSMQCELFGISPH